MIELSRVTHRYGDREVLREVSLSFSERRIAVLGANGSGKSTLARLLNGLLVPTAGSVRVDGFDTATHGAEVRRLVSFVFQNPDAQIVLPTVQEDVSFGLRNRDLPREEIARRVETVLATHGLDEHRDHPAHLLSGGQKQLLALCGVLVVEPAYLVLDEPTTLLDHRNAREIREVLLTVDPAVVVITHDLELAARCDRAVVLEDGQVRFDGDPDAAVADYLRSLG
jgi:biotin transport system ATP-binding protein